MIFTKYNFYGSNALVIGTTLHDSHAAGVATLTAMLVGNLSPKKMKEEKITTLIGRNPDAAAAWKKLGDLYVEALTHSGFAEIRIDVRWLSKGRKEVILASGKQYRYVISNLPALDGAGETEKGGDE